MGFILAKKLFILSFSILLLILITQGVQLGNSYKENQINSSQLIFHSMESSSDDLNIVATLSFAGDWAEEIVGDIYEVSTIVEGGEDPHTYEPTTREIETLSEADLLIAMGPSEHGSLEPWLEAVHDAYPDLEDKTIFLVNESLLEDDNITGTENLHVWMSPVKVKQMVKHLYEHLAELDSVNNATFTSNYNLYVTKLDNLLGRINSAKTEFQGTKVVVHHPAFKYLFDLLGIVRVGAIEEQEGAPAGPQHLDTLRQKMEDDNVNLIITQVQKKGDWDEVHQLARDTGAKVAYLTSLLGVYGLNDYIEMMDFDIDALKNPKEPPAEELPGFNVLLTLLFLITVSVILRKRNQSD